MFVLDDLALMAAAASIPELLASVGGGMSLAAAAPAGMSMAAPLLGAGTAAGAGAGLGAGLLGGTGFLGGIEEALAAGGPANWLSGGGGPSLSNAMDFLRMGSKAMNMLGGSSQQPQQPSAPHPPRTQPGRLQEIPDYGGRYMNPHAKRLMDQRQAYLARLLQNRR